MRKIMINKKIVAEMQLFLIKTKNENIKKVKIL